MVRKRGLTTRFAVLLIGIFLLTMAVVYSQSAPTPEGPDTISIDKSTRGSEGVGAVTVQAQAGNVTALTIYDERLTTAWQGYYGNITGNITLEDSDGNSFYSWDVANPRGEIYAANGSTTDWTNVYCLNVTQNEGEEKTVNLPIERPSGAVSSVNSTRIELSYGINATDLDGLNETFFSFYTDTTGFTVAGQTINVDDGCSLGHPYSDSTANTAWQEVILSDNNTLIFTSIIREDQTAFDGGPADFQMLVLENGHTQQATSTTNYFFYVELT